MAVDGPGNLYVADSGNDSLRRMTPIGTNWVVTTLAARFNSPGGVAVDSTGNIYVADCRNQTLRRLTPVGTSWVVTTLAGTAGSSGSADGTGSAAQFSFPVGVAVDSADNLYVADTLNDTIRELTPEGTNWVVTTLAGVAGNFGSADGWGSGAQFNNPAGVAVDRAGNLYVADSINNTIRGVTASGTTWMVTTLAGEAPSTGQPQLPGLGGYADGTGNAAQFNDPTGVAVDGAGNLYVADFDNNTIRKGIPSTSVPPPVLHPPNLVAGQLGFGMTGLPGVTVDVESSGDLQDWQWVGRYILEGGTNYFVSPTPPQGAQFYRAYVH